MLVTLMSPAFTSCELDGPVAHFTVSVNDRLTYLPQESITEMATLNEDFAATPCEKDDAIKRFNAFCNNLQAYYDDNCQKIIATREKTAAALRKMAPTLVGFCTLSSIFRRRRRILTSTIFSSPS